MAGKRMRYRVGLYDRYVVRAILHGYHKSGEIREYLFNTYSINIKPPRLIEILKSLCSKGILKEIKLEEGKRTWSLTYNIGETPHFLLGRVDKHYDIRNESPFIILVKHGDSKMEWLYKKQLLDRVINKIPPEYMGVIQYWIRKTVIPKIETLPKVPRIVGNKRIDIETTIMELVNAVLGRRDVYVAKAIHHIYEELRGFDLYEAKIVYEVSIRIVKMLMEGKEIDSDILNRLGGELNRKLEEYRKTKTLRELSTPPVIDYSEDALKDALNFIAEEFSLLKDREIGSKYMKIILI